jgi:hypothetical protein
LGAALVLSLVAARADAQAPPPPYPYPPHPPPPYPYYPPAPPPYPYPPREIEPEDCPEGTMHYKDEGRSFCVRYKVVESPNTGLIVSGSVIFGTSYVTSLLVATATKFETPAKWLAIPLAGPIVTIATHDYADCEVIRQVPTGSVDTSVIDDECNDEQAADVLITVGLAFDILFQFAGVAMLTAGAATTRERKVPQWGLAPVVTPTYQGVGLTGAF